MQVQLADVIIGMGAPGAGAGAGGSAAMRWMVHWLPDAARVALSRADLARIDAYRGGARELHELLAALPPLTRPIWYEAAVTGRGGTAMVIGYGAVPVEGGGLDIGWTAGAPAAGQLLGPLGPARLTPAALQRPSGLSDESWRELSVAAGIVLRALLLGIGREVLAYGHRLQDPKAFRAARHALRQSAKGLAEWLHLGTDGGRTIRRWEAGKSDIPGPAAVAVGLLLEPDCPERLRPSPSPRWAGGDEREDE